MMRTVNYVIFPVDDGKTVEQFLRKRGLSHALLVRLKQFPNGLLMNGNPVFTSARLKAGSTLQINLQETADHKTIIPAALPLSFIYEDQDLIVINKPAGMAVHPSQGNRESALANALAGYYQKRNDSFSFRPIGRLDKNTSGLVLLAKNALSGCLLSEMMQKRQIRREYLAICTGLLPPSGTIDAPIARVAGSTLCRAVHPDGRPAVTHFERLSYHNNRSLARVWLETGRTHQIRVHMKYIGHPLPGDFLYNPDFSEIGRHALHAASLRFFHPLTDEAMHFSAPLPPDMKTLLQNYDVL